MAIIIERTITVKNDQATLDKPIYLYIEDGDITCLFTINEKEKTARFGSVNKTDYSIIDNNNIDYGQVRIYKPDSGSDSTSRLVLTEKAEVIDDKLHVIFSSKNIDDFSEAGVHKLQIHLYDNEDNRFTIPPVDLHVLMPIGCDNNAAGEAITGYSLLDREGETVQTFDEEGNYNRTTWKKGDIITSNKLNKIEDALYEINAADNNFVTNDDFTTALDNKANAAHRHKAVDIYGLARVATTGSYSDLSGAPNTNNFATKSDITNHNHDSKYAPTTHNHDGKYAPDTHNHEGYITEPDLFNYAKKSFVTESIENSNFVTLPELNSKRYATIDYVDEVLDGLEGGSSPGGSNDNYVTKSYLSTELAAKANVIHEHKEFLTKVPDEYATKEYVSNIVENIDFESDNYPTKEEMNNALANKADSSYVSENYALKSEIPNMVTVPENLSEFTNDTGFVTASEVDDKIAVIELIPGPQGEKGPKGDQGEAFTYDMFTEEQLEALVGPQGEQGPQGPKGEAGVSFTYDMFTPEQLDGLVGPQGEQGIQGEVGPQGEQGPQGYQGPKGDKGDKGDQGPKGADGTVTFDELTDAQLEMIRGPQGDRGPKGDRGEQGPRGYQGYQGEKGEKGDKGDKFTYAELTPEDKADLTQGFITCSDNIKRIEIVTAYPDNPEDDVLYIRVEG